MRGCGALLSLASLCIPLSLSACSSGKLDLGGPTSTSEEPIGPNDVVGIVQSSEGSPAWAYVLSGGTLTQTDAQGRFILRNAPAHYDVLLVPNWNPGPTSPRAPASQPGGQSVSVWLGLTTRHPILFASGFPSSAPVAWGTGGLPFSSLNVTWPPPTVVDTQHLLLYEIPDLGTGGLNPSSDMATIAMPAQIWLQPGTSSADAKIASFTFTGPQGAPPANYLGYAATTLHFEVGSTTSWAPTYAPVESMTVTGSPKPDDPSQSQTFFESYLYAQLSDVGAWARVAPLAETLPPFSFVVPKVPGISWAIQFSAALAGGATTWAWARVGSDGTVPPTRIPAQPRPVSPPDGTTGFGTGSVLTWTGEGVCTVFVSSADQADRTSPALTIVTDQQTATIPDMTPLGVTLPSRVTYRWSETCSQSSAPRLGGDPVLLGDDPLASGGNSAFGPTFVTK
jgi:hypothetical protein